jgi:hypothetical protein
MARSHTWASRVAAATAALTGLGLVSLVTAEGRVRTYVDVPVVVIALVAIAGAAKLWRDNCLESRVAVMSVAAAAAAGITLATTIGLPGQEPRDLTVHTIGLLMLAGAVAVLLLIDRTLRRPADGSKAPYAL